MNEVVHCTTQLEWDIVNSKLGENALPSSIWNVYVDRSCKELHRPKYSDLNYFKDENYKIYTFTEWEFFHSPVIINNDDYSSLVSILDNLNIR